MPRIHLFYKEIIKKYIPSLLISGVGLMDELVISTLFFIHSKVAGGILIPDVHVRLATVAKGAMVEPFGQVKLILFGLSENTHIYIV